MCRAQPGGISYGRPEVFAAESRRNLNSIIQRALIVPHAPRGNASADALRRNRMTQRFMGGLITRRVSCLNVDRRSAFATVVTSDCSHRLDCRQEMEHPSNFWGQSRLCDDPQNRDEPRHRGSELAHECCVDRSARSAWECIRRRSASKSDDGLRHGRLCHAVGQLPQCRLTHRIRDRRNLTIAPTGCVLIRRTVTIPDTVGVSLLTNAVIHSTSMGMHPPTLCIEIG